MLYPQYQTPLVPAGPQAQHIEHTLLLIFWITTLVYVVVIAILAFSVLRSRDLSSGLPRPIVPSRDTDRSASRIVGGAIIVTIVLILVMMIDSFITSHRTAVLADQARMRIDVHAQQWWWEVEYPDEHQPHQTLFTANEIHIPTGVVVDIHGTSRDVIHSFWAPNIHGKKDLIPGYENDLMIKVDEPGTWRGQCAEFCGMQHAQMAFDIVAQSPDEFSAWYRQQLTSAPDPMTSATQHGRDVFLSHACGLCHTIRGTEANGTTGPDLTHLASRSMIAAGSRKNDVANLTAWVIDAQRIKPGCKMPPNLMPSAELNDLVAYLETLR